MTANEKYISQIEEGIARYQYEVQLAQENNRQHKNIYGENFVRDMLNIVCLDVNFINANSIQKNIKGIDLVCDENNRCIQVTTDKDRDKVRDSYKGFKELSDYSQDYTLEFFYLLGKPNYLTLKT